MNLFFDGAWAASSLHHLSKATLRLVLKKVYSLLKENGIFYLSVKKGTGEVLEKDERYEGNHEKFWCYFEEEEFRELLTNAGFSILDLTLIEKVHDYQSHSVFRAFCQSRK